MRTPFPYLHERESVPMPRRDFSRKVRKAAIARAAGHCEKCKATLKLREGEVDHILPDVLGGEPVLANAQVLCRLCHAEKSGDDLRRTRKADRQGDKASGAMRRRIVDTPKMQSAPMPTSPRAAGRQPKQALPPKPMFERAR